MEMDYLYWYRRGDQPVLSRTKTVRPEINNKVVENHASEIVAFKNGYFLTQPAFYISRKEDPSITEKVKRLNEYLYLSGKQQADNLVTDWFHTVGVGIIYVTPYKDPECPIRAYALDPRSSFVVYSRDPGNEPVMGVNAVISTGETPRVIFDVFTREKYFRVSGDVTEEVVTGTPVAGTAIEVLSDADNVLHEIPIIEYKNENNRMGSCEAVKPLLD